MQSQNWQDSVVERIIPIKIDVQIFLRTFCGTSLVREQEQDNITTHICFFVWNPPRWYLLLSSLALALFCWGLCPWHCQSTHPRCSCCECCARDTGSTCHGGCTCFCCLFLFFLLIPTITLYEIRGMNLPNLPGVSR
jgi:hypothetical protein